jgi:2-polyprenyl-3-methyl-5-hydroxy-6-metoxy-1,4-benzoquinol methylase/tetratricopeptide (TPR) repeat protein
MNRKERRAAARQDQSAANRPGTAPIAEPSRLFQQAVSLQHHGQASEAVRLYKRLLALNPDHAEAHNNVGCVLLAEGKPKEAAVHFVRSLTLLPQLCDDFASIAALLADVNPALRDACKQAAEAWPAHLPSPDLSNLSAIAADVLLRHVLRSTPVRDLALERLLTSIRFSLLQAATWAGGNDRIDEDLLGFCGALAQQCFINEYVFATTAEEARLAEQLKDKLAEDFTAATPVAALRILTVATYFPLHTLRAAQDMLDRRWPGPVADVLKQQVDEPLQERRYRDSIPRLTPIGDATSIEVQRQYEENPYPRWVYAASAVPVTTLNDHLRAAFPTVPFRPLEKDGVDILVAGCGTGRHPIEVARLYENSRVLAIDLSLSSLCYAKRKTPPDVADRIEYGQADILQIDTLDRSFDMIDSSGVLHHMADPFAAWRTLLTSLRPNGFMRVGLYSEIARRNMSINPARAFIAERGYASTADDIRRCRQDLLNSPFKGVATAGDFFSTSECRDLLFHVQERQLIVHCGQRFEVHRIRVQADLAAPVSAAVLKGRLADDRPQAVA